MQNVFKLITLAERAWSQIHLKSHERLGNRMHCFHRGAKNREISSKVLCSTILIRQNWEDLFLKVIQITCSVRQHLNFWDKSIKLDLSIVISMSFSNKLAHKDWNYRTLTMDMLNLEENKLDCKKNNLWRKKLLRDTQIRNVHELGEMKRAQELRVHEFSVQKVRESHDTIQRLTSQLQKMQEHMNSMNDSGEFQEVESNHSGRLSHLPSQLAMIPSFFLCAEPRQTFAIWYMECTWVTGKRFW